MSVTQVLQIHHYHLHGIARLNRTPASNRRSWLNGLEPWQAGLVMLVGFAVVLWLIALGFVEARDELVLVLLTMTSINFGTGAGRLARASPLCVVRPRLARARRGVWAAIEESVGLRPGFSRRAARWLVHRYADKRRTCTALSVLTVFSDRVRRLVLQEVQAAPEDPGP